MSDENHRRFYSGRYEGLETEPRMMKAKRDVKRRYPKKDQKQAANTLYELRKQGLIEE